MNKYTRIRLMFRLYARILPTVHRGLKRWKFEAEKIPNLELRKQAKNSIQTKSFHCEGGSVFALLLDKDMSSYLTFIVAFQTISDYLDNLCDRSVGQDERHFRQLHLAMSDALNPNQKPQEYYRYSKNQDDGGYLSKLVLTCQAFLADCQAYRLVQSDIECLNANYINLQVYKHLSLEIREERLKNWVQEMDTFGQEWYQFAAATGSTLGIFVLLACAQRGCCEKQEIKHLYELYFPYIQGFHILLDYYIDTEEDEIEGDMNFCAYFKNEEDFYQHMYALYWKVSCVHTQVVDGSFHKMVMHALLGMYLADTKVRIGKNGSEISNRLLEIGGKNSRFFYQQVKWYKRLHKEI